MNPLITKADISVYRPISKSVHSDKINTYIEDAQLLDLLPLLGEKLYFDLIDNPTKYNDLLNQTAYKYENQTIVSPGIKKVLSLYAYARYIMHGSQTDTPFGLVEKKYQDGENVSRTDKKEIYKQTQQSAYQYWLQVESYLNRNASNYELWDSQNHCSASKKTFRFNHITR